MRIEKLNPENVEQYLEYLKTAFDEEPEQMTAACGRHEIDQYYLIRSVKPEADRFYHGFEGAELSEAPLLRKDIIKA